MALKDIVIPTRTLAYAGEQFTVHGVTANDVMRMLIEAEHDVGRLIDAFEGLKTGDEADVQAAVGIMLRETPELVARLIATAADEPQSWPTVVRLPISVQTEALYAIWAMTFEEPDSVKRFAASLTEIVKSMTALTPQKAA